MSPRGLDAAGRQKGPEVCGGSEARKAATAFPTVLFSKECILVGDDIMSVGTVILRTAALASSH